MTIRTSSKRRFARWSPIRHTALLFGVSSAFPVIASLIDATRLPRQLGWLDVAVAAALVIAAARTVARYQTLVTDADRVVAWRHSQRFFHIVPLMLALFFVAGDRIDWPVLVIGISWRTWLLLYTWPSLVAASRHDSDVSRVQSSGSPNADHRTRNHGRVRNPD